MESAAWVYIVTNKPRGVLYIGATTDLQARARHHRSGRGSHFASKYNCEKLVYFERHDTIAAAKTRERAMKAWKRAWKIELVERANPAWNELAPPRR
jgi:putative endonuclease